VYARREEMEEGKVITIIITPEEEAATKLACHAERRKFSVTLFF
jgi:hypothetical protein